MNANEILGRLNKAVRNIIWIGDVYAFTLPPGEVYNAEPFGEVGPLNFVHHSISELKFAAALVTELADARATQKSAWYEARIAELEANNAALVAERDEAVWRSDHLILEMEAMKRDLEFSRGVINGVRNDLRAQQEYSERFSKELHREKGTVDHQFAQIRSLYQQLNDVLDWSAAWKRAAVMYRGAFIYRTTGKTGPHAPAVPYDDPDADELAPFGWNPRDVVPENRSTVGLGYERGEG